MISLSLYKVTVTYKDLLQEREWDTKLKLLAARPNLSFDDVPPTPERKRFDRFVAVYPDYGCDVLGTAAEMALVALVGPREKWVEFAAVVESVELIEDVSVQEVPRDASASP